jgi:hypothetical protein
LQRTNRQCKLFLFLAVELRENSCCRWITELEKIEAKAQGRRFMDM